MWTGNIYDVLTHVFLQCIFYNAILQENNAVCSFLHVGKTCVTVICIFDEEFHFFSTIYVLLAFEVWISDSNKQFVCQGERTTSNLTLFKPIWALNSVTVRNVTLVFLGVDIICWALFVIPSWALLTMIIHCYK
jgi:hypothetical protein